MTPQPFAVHLNLRAGDHYAEHGMRVVQVPGHHGPGHGARLLGRLPGADRAAAGAGAGPPPVSSHGLERCREMTKMIFAANPLAHVRGGLQLVGADAVPQMRRVLPNLVLYCDYA